MGGATAHSAGGTPALTVLLLPCGIPDLAALGGAVDGGGAEAYSLGEVPALTVAIGTSLPAAIRTTAASSPCCWMTSELTSARLLRSAGFPASVHRSTHAFVLLQVCPNECSLAANWRGPVYHPHDRSRRFRPAHLARVRRIARVPASFDRASHSLAL